MMLMSATYTQCCYARADAYGVMATAMPVDVYVVVMCLSAGAYGNTLVIG